MGFNFDVIVVGSYTIDLVFSGLAEFPELGKDILSTAFQMTPGEASISAVSMHRLGLKVGWAADFGNDDFSRFALKFVQEEGLDESLFVHHNRPLRRITAAASYPEDRAFITYYDPDPQIPAAMPALIKSNARLLFVPGLYSGSLIGPASKIIRSKKMTLVMDGNSSLGDMIGDSKQSKAIRKAIKLVDIFLPNAREARRLTGEQELPLAIQFLGELCPTVVVKDGANGSWAYADHHLIHIPAISVDPVDTTGAGDNFNAGFLYAWLEGQSIENCLKWGNVVGGLSTTVMGGTVRKVTCDEVRKYLDNWKSI
jgi:sugar/nucleoside kinase (ribokinase family)